MRKKYPRSKSPFVFIKVQMPFKQLCKHYFYACLLVTDRSSA